MPYYGIIPFSLTVERFTSQSELSSGLLGPFKVATDRKGEFDGIVYMSIIAL